MINHYSITKHNLLAIAARELQTDQAVPNLLEAFVFQFVFEQTMKDQTSDNIYTLWIIMMITT